MTAEVAVLNEQAVALATDSAVSVGSGKIYTSANKLFTLSKCAPVGVMIFNNARHMSIPLETIIKEFRSELGTTQYDSLPEYSGAFETFLRDQNNYLFDSQNRERGISEYIVLIGRYYFRKLVEQIEARVRERFIASFRNNQPPPSTPRVISGLLRSHVSHLEKLPDVSEPNESDMESVFMPQVKLIDQIIDDIFLAFPITDPSRRLLQRILVLHAVKEWYAWSGIVVAGFGDKDAYPKLTSFYLGVATEDVSGQIASLKLKFRKGREFLTADPAIIPFAQSEEVYRFITGIDPDYKKFLLSYWDSLLKGYTDAISAILPGLDVTLAKEMRKLADKQFQDLMHVMDQREREQYTDPVLSNLGNLPKDELAMLAESLVSLTSIKRRVSTEPESVGGPIDVAVISKGDGFIWIKRKHYFQKELNPAFFTNYFRGLESHNT